MVRLSGGLEVWSSGEAGATTTSAPAMVNGDGAPKVYKRKKLKKIKKKMLKGLGTSETLVEPTRIPSPVRDDDGWARWQRKRNGKGGNGNGDGDGGNVEGKGK